jgi:hypothetical protein
MATNIETRAVLKFAVDRAMLNKAIRANSDLEQSIVDIREAADRQAQAAQATLDVMEKVATIGTSIFNASAQAAEQYAQSAEAATATSERWLSTNQRIADAQTVLAEKQANALLPYRDALASVLELTSELPDEVITFGVNAGAVLSAIGTVGTIGAQITRFASEVRILGTYVQTLGLQQGATRAAVGVGAIGVGTVAGIGAVQAIGRATGDERLAQYGFDDLFETLRDSLGAIGALFIRAARDWAKILVDTNSIMALLAIKVEEAGDSFVRAIMRAYYSILEGIGSLSADTGLGVKIDLGDILGIDVEEARQRIDELTESTKDYGAAAEEVGKRNEELKARIDANTMGLTEGLLDLLGITEREARRIAADLEADFEQKYDVARAVYNYLEASDKAIMAFNDSQLEATKEHHSELENLAEEYHTSQEEALAEHNTSLQELAAEYQQARQDNEAAHNKKLAGLRDNYEDATTKAAAEFNKSRQKVIDDYNAAELKRIEEFNRARERADADHRDRLRDAAGRLDAIAVLNELRSYKKDQSRAKEDFDNTTKERRNARQEQLKDLQASYVEQKQARDNQYKEALADQRQAYSEQQAATTQAYNAQVATQKQAYNEMRTAQDIAYHEELNSLKTQFNERQQAQERQFRQELELQDQAFQERLKAMMGFEDETTAFLRRNLDGYNDFAQAIIDNIMLIEAERSKLAPEIVYTPSTTPSRASGGYLNAGMFKGHPNEYVLNRQTTGVLERLTGGILTQQSVQNIANNSRSVTVGALNINGDIGGYTPQQIKVLAQQGLVELLGEMG